MTKLHNLSFCKKKKREQNTTKLGANSDANHDAVQFEWESNLSESTIEVSVQFKWQYNFW